MNAHPKTDSERRHDGAGIGPGRLWSLWDMLEFKALAFYQATTAFARLERILADHKSVTINADGSATVAWVSDPVVLNIIKETAQTLTGECRALGAELTLDALYEFRHELGSQITFEEITTRIDELRKLLSRELKRTTLLALNQQERRLWEPDSPLLGKEFENKFQKAGIYELDEAAKCLALSRSTAAVFHLMRLMEVGIGAVGRSLGIPDPIKGSDRSWGKILEKIKDAMTARGGSKPTMSWANPKDKEFFESAYASLNAVRVAWRNTTMHVESKYTDDEAEHIFTAVKGFMKNLASRMDENGEPKA
jgi:hypothetical protein